jgi:alkylated DNA repair dioxygenase AlkB
MEQAELFDTASKFPRGFCYVGELISHAQEQRLVHHFQELEFKPFEFHGFLGKRRIVSFGWRYDFSGGGLQKTNDIPRFLEPLRRQAAGFAKLKASDLQHVLVTEYQPGAAIGWHKDRSVFGEVVGISLLSTCTFRLRRKIGTKWERAAIVAAPRSAYLLSGPARTEWEHSIPAVPELRYSITFRNFKGD